MTIQGAIAELQTLINADDVPCYYNGCIEKVIETIQMEIPINCGDAYCDRGGTYMRLGKIKGEEK